MKRGSGFSRWMKAHPATPRLAHVRADALKPTIATVPCKPLRAHDEYRCWCGKAWGIDEPPPACHNTTSNKGNDK